MPTRAERNMALRVRIDQLRRWWECGFQWYQLKTQGNVTGLIQNNPNWQAEKTFDRVSRVLLAKRTQTGQGATDEDVRSMWRQAWKWDRNEFERDKTADACVAWYSEFVRKARVVSSCTPVSITFNAPREEGGEWELSGELPLVVAPNDGELITCVPRWLPKPASKRWAENNIDTPFHSYLGFFVTAEQIKDVEMQCVSWHKGKITLQSVTTPCNTESYRAMLAAAQTFRRTALTGAPCKPDRFSVTCTKKACHVSDLCERQWGSGIPDS